MARLSYVLDNSRFALIALLNAAVLLGPGATADAASSPQPVWLEVYVNGHPAGLFAKFFFDSKSRMAAEVLELNEIGIKPGGAAAAGVVFLDEIPGLTYRYDAQRQKIEFSVPPDRMLAHNYSAASDQKKTRTAQSSFGAVVNYGIYGSLQAEDHPSDLQFGGASARLEGRVFGKSGTLEGSGIFGSTFESDHTALRLDTFWSSSSQETAVTGRVGDFISSGLPWTRPMRLGGVQLQRNFGLRPDLITSPLPTFSGSATVPSTVDVLVNNVSAYSQDVPAGPFTIDNIPVMAGSGVAHVVVRDVTGRTTETSVPFFTSPKLLREGVFDFSGEIGVARQGFGVESFGYGDQILALGTLRYGVTDSLTLEGHAEVSEALLNAGLGVVTPVGGFGVLTVAGSASHDGDSSGAQLYGALDIDGGFFSIHLSTQRSFGGYNDLAGVNAELYPGDADLAQTIGARPAVAIDTVSLGTELPWDGASFNLGYLHYETAAHEKAGVLHATFSQQLSEAASFYVTASGNLYAEDEFGVHASLSISLGKWGRGSVGASSDSGTTRLTADLVKPASHEPGSFGWALRASESGAANFQAALAHQGSKARIEGGVWQYGAEGTTASASVDGALAIIDNGIFLSSSIDDAFALVDVGMPDVNVLFENRPAGKTGADGKLLVTGLRSYESNKISIDPIQLPADAEIDNANLEIVPADRSGVIVDFNVGDASKSAVVVFRSADRNVVPVGARGVVRATGEEFAVGYDGRAFIKNLAAQNTVAITLSDGECAATFPFAPRPGEQVVIEDVICS